MRAIRNRDHDGMDPRMEQAIERLQGLIQQQFPGTTFELRRDPDEHVNVLLIATMDVDEPDEVLDLLDDELHRLQVEERIPLYVIPLHTPERVQAELAAQAQRL